tara:strand:+ start:691 stop:1194 length:504 start_codon:yes stop_codon:yes gene_type:complete
LRISAYILLSSILVSCWSNPRPKNDTNSITLEDLLLLKSEQRIKSEMLILDSLSQSMGWSAKALSGGILVENIIDKEGSLNVDGDTVFMNVNVSLVNGNKCFANDTISLIVDHYDGAPVYNVLAKNMSLGDSCKALVPSDMAYGVRGVPGSVPPGAMLLVEVRQLAF